MGEDNERGNDHQRLARYVPYVLAAFAVVSIFVTLASFGHYISAPWSLRATVTDSCSEARSSQGSVITDMSRKRVLLLNSNNEIVDVKQSSQLSTPAIFYGQVATADGAIYVDEYTYYQGTDYLASEYVMKYDMEGNTLGKVLELEYDLDSNRTMQPEIYEIHVSAGEDRGCILLLSAIDNSLERVGFSTNINPEGSSSDDALPAGLKDNVSGATSCVKYNTLPSSLPFYAVQFNPDSGSTYISDVNGTVFKTSDDGATYVLTDERTVDDISIDTCPTENSVIPFTPFLTVRILAFWICVIYLSILLIALVVRAFIFTFKKRDWHSITTVLSVLVIILLSVGVAVFYSANIRTMNAKTTANELSSYAGTMSNCLNGTLVNVSQVYTQDGTLPLDSYNEISETLETCSQSVAKSELGVTLYFVVKGPDDKFVYFGDSARSTLCGSLFSTSRGNTPTIDKLEDSKTYSTTSSNLNQLIYEISPVRDKSDNVVGYIIATRELTSFSANSIGSLISLALTLANILIIISFIALEGKEWGVGFSRGRALRKAKSTTKKAATGREIALARPLYWLVVASTTVDASILPLIAQDLLQGTGLASSGLAVASPTIAMMTSCVIGAPLQAWLNRRFSIRDYVGISSVFAGLAFAGCFVAVFVKSLALLVACVFFVHLLMEIVFVYVSTLPLRFDSGTNRSKANRSFAASGVSAGAIAGLLGGIVADNFGNQWVYVLGCIIALIITFMVLALLADGSSSTANAAGDKGSSAGTALTTSAKNADAPEKSKTKLRHVLFDPVILSVLVFMVTTSLMATGYQSYLFPLLASEQGLTKTMVASLIAYCNALIFYTTPALTRLEQRMGPRTLLFGAGLLLSFAFLFFLVNSSPLWIIIVLAIASLAQKTITPAYTTLWQNRVFEIGSPKDSSSSLIMTAISGIGALRTPALGALVEIFGLIFATPIVGAYCLVNTILFMVSTRKRIKKNVEQESDASQSHR